MTPESDRQLTGPWTIRGLIDLLASRKSKAALAESAGGVVRYATSEDLARRATAIGAGLLAAGVLPGDPVIIIGENGIDWVVARLGIGAIGAVAVALDPQISPVEATAIVKSTKARFAFASPAHVDKLKDGDKALAIFTMGGAAAAGDRDIPALAGPASGAKSIPESIDPDLPAMLVFTSGTTGNPKRFVLANAQIGANVEALIQSGLIADKDRVLLPLPLHHAYPLVVGLLTSLSAGALVIFPQSASGRAIIEAAQLARATIMVGVPRLYAALLVGLEARAAAHGRFARRLYRLFLAGAVGLRHVAGGVPGQLLFHRLRASLGPDLRLLVSGGAKLDLETAEAMEALGWRMRSGYGLAETASVFTGNIPGAERLGSEGRPLGRGQIRIVQGEAGGEVQLRGPCLFTGYLDNPEENARAFTADGWFRTGDLGYLDQDGFLYITGRSKELIVLGGGKKVFPEEVERVYAGSRFIEEMAVLERSGSLVALVMPKLTAIRAAAVARPEDAIRVALAERSQNLPAYARVSGFALTSQMLPRTRLGKYRRFLLPALYERALRHEEAPVAGLPSDEDRALLAQPAVTTLWKLLQERYGQALTPDATLQLDLGLDSLGWMALALEMEHRLAIRLDDAAVNRILTVRDLLREVVAAPPESRNPAAPLDPRWTAPRNPWHRALGYGIQAGNRAVMRTGFRLRVRGAENLPAAGPCIIAPNHVSFLDPAALAAALPRPILARTYWAADRILMFSNPASRLICRSMCIFPVDSRSPAGVIAAAVDVLKQGHVLVWFPEGWRAPSKDLLPFQPGIGRLVAETGAPVVPAYVNGTFESLPRGRRFPRLLPVTVTFGRLVSAAALLGDAPAHDWQAAANRLRDIVADLAKD